MRINTAGNVILSEEEQTIRTDTAAVDVDSSVFYVLLLYLQANLFLESATDVGI
jgi:hypothetical protein